MANDTLWRDDGFITKYQQLSHEQRTRVHRLVDDMLADRHRFDWRRLAETWPNIWDVVAHEMDGLDFEDLVAMILAAEDFTYAPNLRRSADRGVDLFRVMRDDAETIIECKLRRAKPVGAPVVRQLAGACDQHGVRCARIYTNRTFTPEAKLACAEISRSSAIAVELFDGAALHRTLCGPGGAKLRRVLESDNLHGLQEMLRATGRSDLYIRRRTPSELPLEPPRG